MKLFRLSLFALLFCSFSSPLFAATLTVCASGCNYSTIQAAVNGATSGDTLTVSAGNYTSFTVSGKTLTITGASASTTKIDGGGSASPVDIASSAHVTLSGFTLTNPGGFTPVVNVNLSTLSLSDAIIDASGGAFFYGIKMSTAGANTLTLNNLLISGYGTYGIQVDGSGSSVTATNITLDGGGSGSAGIRTNNGTTTIKNAIISNHASSCLLTQGGSTLNYSYTDCFSVTTIVGGTAGSGNITTDPGFVGGGDFSLATGSSAIDAGDPHTLDADASRADLGYTGGKGGTASNVNLDVPTMYSTIDLAIAAAEAGDTIRVSQGSYGSLSFSSPTPSPLTLKGSYDAGFTTQSASTTPAVLSSFTISSGFTGTITVDSFEITGSASQGVALSPGSSSASVTLTNNIVHNNASIGIYLSNTVGTLAISGNTVYSNGSAGISGIGSASSLSITNNTVYSNGDGIHFTTAPSGTLVQGNLSYSNTGSSASDGIYIVSGGALTVSDNRTYSNAGSGIYVQSANPVSVTNNVSYSNSVYGIRTENATVSDFSGNVIVSNTSEGGVINGSNGTPTVNNNVFASNDRGLYFGDPTAFISHGPIPSSMNNNIFFGNTFEEMVHIDLFPLATFETTAELNSQSWESGNRVIDPGFSGTNYSLFDLSATSYSVGEGDGTLQFTINRYGTSSSNVSVQYATSDGTAKAGTNYTTTSATASFAKGTNSTTVSIPILYNAPVTSNKTFTITLSSPTGGVLMGNATTATATIIESTSVPLLSNFGMLLFVFSLLGFGLVSLRERHQIS